ncbi:MAG: hypothetical protein R2699_16750 [Acidimicrobiales bacterium]
MSATTIHPGGIKTNIARSARIDDSVNRVAPGPGNPVEGFEKMLRTTPEKAARQIIEAVRARTSGRRCHRPDARCSARCPACRPASAVDHRARRPAER